MKQKETRVYIMDATKAKDYFDNISGYDFENWKAYEDCHDKLTPEAEHFITVCEAEGLVYSIYSFMTAFNVEETVGANDYVYITNNY